VSGVVGCSPLFYSTAVTRVSNMSDTQIIETGDSVKVKQVLDDAAMEAVSVHVSEGV
jgi:hypothetical protein